MLEKHHRRNTPLRRPKHSSSVEFTETDNRTNIEKNHQTRQDRFIPEKTFSDCCRGTEQAASWYNKTKVNIFSTVENQNARNHVDQ